MLNVYLLRHGQTRYNAEGNRYCGQTDIPLTEKGVRQAELVAVQLSGITFEAIYSSPLQRAYVTAGLASGGKPVIKDERLTEADFGAWEGKTKEEFIAEDPALWANWMKDPALHKAGGTGDTAQSVVDRVDNFFLELLTKYEKGNILVVAHNGVNRFYLAHKLGMPLSNYRKIVQENSAITMFELDEQGELTLVHLNSLLK